MTTAAILAFSFGALFGFLVKSVLEEDRRQEK